MYKVLLVDDEPFILDGLSCIIDWADHDLEIAGQVLNGVEALKVIEKTSINILITDIRMPEMDGLELIRYIRKKNIDIKCIVLSGYDDFTYVKECAKLGIENYLLKPVDISEFSSTLKNTIRNIESELYKKSEYKQGLELLKKNILYHWITGNISYEDLSEKAGFLDINIESTNFQVILLKILKDFSPENKDILQDKEMSLLAIQNIISEALAVSLNCTVFCSSDNDSVIIVHDEYSPKTVQLLDSTLKRCINDIRSILKLHTFITAGNIVDHCMKVHESWLNARILQDYSIVSPKNSIIYLTDISKNTSVKPKIFLLDLKALQGFIISRDIDAATNLINILFDGLQKIDNLAPSSIYDSIIELVFNITRIVRSVNSNATTQFEQAEDHLANIFKLGDLEEIRMWVQNLLQKSISFIKDEDLKYSPVIKKILDYIHVFYYEDINLALISEEYNVNTDYLGRIFKNEVGDSFTNYLNRIRVEKAKELLSSTSFKANEISRKVGYVNANYFYTVFRKVTGVSPLEYKDLHL